MRLTSAQIKGRIKNVALNNNADARVLIRIYMMEKFLERLSTSHYKNNFIVKGGMLITSLIGISFRSTMDLDVSIKNYNLSINDMEKVINKICSIDLDDGISFSLTNIENIMDEMEYPGIRVSINSFLEQLIIPFSIDISTGDIITPKEIDFNYHLMLEDRYINIWTYNIETILAEKLQTIFARGTLNTRMRDFYDIYVLGLKYRDNINISVLSTALVSTYRKRNTLFTKDNMLEISNNILADKQMNDLWKSYTLKYPFAFGIDFVIIIEFIKKLIVTLII